MVLMIMEIQVFGFLSEREDLLLLFDASDAALMADVMTMTGNFVVILVIFSFFEIGNPPHGLFLSSSIRTL